VAPAGPRPEQSGSTPRRAPVRPEAARSPWVGHGARTVRLRAVARLPPDLQRVRPVRHSEPGCSVVDHAAEALPAPSESAASPQPEAVGRLPAEVLALAQHRPLAAEKLAPAFLFLSPAPAAALRAQPGASAPQAQAPLQGEPAARDAAAEQPGAAERRQAVPDAPVALRPAEVVARVAARRAAGAAWVAVEVPLQAAAVPAAAAVQQPEELAAAAVQPAVPGAPAGALPSAVAWVVV
jgi:hypothetical protein